jgi:hypothetical protein
VPDVSYLRHWAFGLAVLTILILRCAPASAAVSREVYIPLTFQSEDDQWKTSACLLVHERIYPAAAEAWRGFTPPSDAAERAFEAVFAAIRAKDRDSLMKTIDPGVRSSIKNYDEESKGLFSQFETIQLVNVARAYEFDGLVVFFGAFKSGARQAYAPLVFAREADGSFGFLPYRSKAVTYMFVKDWFDAKWGPSNSDSPAYCTSQQVAGATHRFRIGGAEPSSAQSWQPSMLYLSGAAFEKAGRFATPVARIKSWSAMLKAALQSDQIGDITSFFTPHGGSRLKDWYAGASEPERKVYRESIVGQQPFFMFDLSSVLVVYTKSGAGAVQTMYLATGGDKLLWTNSATITNTDDVFKRGVLFAAASGKSPFADGEIK